MSLNTTQNNKIQIVTKAKQSCVAFEKPAAKKTGRGHPPKKGEVIKLKKLFETKKDAFTETTVIMYGKQSTVSYYCINLL